ALAFTTRIKLEVVSFRQDPPEAMEPTLDLRRDGALRTSQQPTDLVLGEAMEQVQLDRPSIAGREPRERAVQVGAQKHLVVGIRRRLRSGSGLPTMQKVEREYRPALPQHLQGHVVDE